MCFISGCLFSRCVEHASRIVPTYSLNEGGAWESQTTMDSDCPKTPPFRRAFSLHSISISLGLHGQFDMSSYVFCLRSLTE